MAPKTPRNVSMWQHDTRSHPCTDIHFLDPKYVNSGSKVTSEQFYALRVLRRPTTMTDEHLADLGISDLQEARDLLEAYTPWRLFLGAVDDVDKKPTAAMGMFATVLKNKRMACGNVVKPPPALNVTLRTRPQARAAYNDGADDDDVGVGEEEEILGDDGEKDDDGDGRVGNDNGAGVAAIGPFSARPVTPPLGRRPAAGNNPATPHTPASNEGLGPGAFPKIDDEAVVNKAFIDSAQALTQLAHDAGRLNFDIEWTIQRAAFRVYNGDDKVFEAQNDGHLSQQANNGPGEPKVSTEVKADVRAVGTAVLFQEGAQLAAWISSGRADGRPAETKWHNDGRYR